VSQAAANATTWQVAGSICVAVITAILAPAVTRWVARDRNQAETYTIQSDAAMKAMGQVSDLLQEELQRKTAELKAASERADAAEAAMVACRREAATAQLELDMIRRRIDGHCQDFCGGKRLLRGTDQDGTHS
jgi:uncharacterized membrane protein YhiD involved in acid resistance